MSFRLLTAALAGFMLAGGALAQSQPEDPAAETEQSRAERDRELAQAQREMDEARRELESAAREIARLTAGRFMRDGDFDFDFDFDFDGGPFGLGLERAYLGVNIDDTEGGVLVKAVTPGSPAADAGVLTGDVITSINGVDLAGTDGGDADGGSEALVEEMARIDPGAIVTLTLERDGGEQTINVETTEAAHDTLVFRDGGPGVFFADGGPGRRFAQAVMPGFFASRWREIELATLTPELGSYFGTDTGLLVVRAPSNADLDLLDGDVILAIGGREPNSPEHAMRILTSFAPGETLELEIMRQQRRETVEYAIPEDDD